MACLQKTQNEHLCSDAVTKIIQCYILTSLCLLLITNDFASFHSIIYEKYVELSLEFFISEYVHSMLLQHDVLFSHFDGRKKKSRKSSSIIYVGRMMLTNLQNYVKFLAIVKSLLVKKFFLRFTRRHTPNECREKILL